MIIGFDTSCYTTSMALINEAGEIVENRRRLLTVPLGAKGLRQSEALFQHLKNLPQLLGADFAGVKLTAVAAGVRPRPVADSYLPVFTAGASFGETLAQILGVPFLGTSHQEGHLRAGLIGQPLLAEPILAWHLSGGTTELLLVKPNFPGYEITKIGGSSDLQIGQLIDRIGVLLGAAFPAGPALERMAVNSSSSKVLPLSIKDLTFSLSGPATAAERLVGQLPATELARQIFNSLSKVILKISCLAAEKYRIKRVLLVGGVAANQLMRADLRAAEAENGLQFEFGPQELSSDNAVGVALIGYDYFQARKG